MQWHEIMSDAQKADLDISISRARIAKLEEHHNLLLERIEQIEENCSRLFAVVNQNFITLNEEIKALGGFAEE